MEQPDGHAHVTPYRLCALCRQLVARYSEDILWDVTSYNNNDNGKLPMIPGPQTLGVLAQPLAHYDNLASLQKSAAEGCHLCAIFSRSSRINQDETDGQRQLYVHVTRFWDRSPPYLRLDMSENSSFLGWNTKQISWVDMYRDRSTSQPKSRYFHNTCPSDSPEARYKWCTTTGCDEGYEMISRWLQQCLNFHESCRKSLDNIRPTRLLDLNAMPSDQDIRLVHAEDVGKQPYATLSYRWGESANARLKMSNYEEFRTRIVLESLPRTIREAVKVCRGLLVRYLWIDSLCIIQEDGEDLAHEIAQMGSIYAGSIITVAAADSTDCESGCFRERHPLSKDDCIVTGIDHTFVFSCGSECYRHDQTLKQSKLNERGWVYQEEVLSPRTVHFTANEIIWECRERRHCHRCAEEQRELTNLIPYYPPKLVFSKLHDLPLSSTRDERFWRIWSSIIDRYTGSQLSSADDRLSALAGIAQLAHDKVRSQASYGIWLENFLEGLLWSKQPGPGNPLPRDIDTLNLAPSWSWASNQCKICNWGDDTPTLYTAKITKFPHATPFAQITELSKSPPGSTLIRIYGCLRACHIVPSLYGGWYLVPMIGNSGNEVETYITAAWEAYNGRNESDASDQSMRMQSEEWNEDQRTEPKQKFCPDREPRQRKNLVCVLLKRELQSVIHEICIIDRSIVCESVSSSQKLFRRVGYLSENMVVRKAGDISWSKSDILKHLGFYRHRDNTVRVPSSLSVDASTVVQHLGLALDDIQDQDHSLKEVAPEDLLWVDGELSLFQDGYEEAEIEII